jgi:hypothetical protein
VLRHPAAAVACSGLSPATAVIAPAVADEAPILEPMLDADTDALVKAVRPYVSDAIWLGKINRLRNILPLNCPNDPEAIRRGDALVAIQSDQAIRALYARYRKDHLIKWKDSIKTVVGLNRPTSAGLDE